jgi:seryl-tRNA synthetase
MLDLKFIRNNPELIKDSIKRRCININFDRFMELDKTIIKTMQNLDQKRFLKNKVSKEIPNILYQEDKDTKIREMKSL